MGTHSRLVGRDADGAGGAAPVPRWQDALYAFVDIDVLDVAATGEDVLLQVAIVGRRGEPDLSALIDSGRARWLPPRHPHRCVAGLSARPPIEVCPDLRSRISGRVVVVHGLGLGWPLLAATCSPLRPLALLDNLRLAGELLPGLAGSLADLMKRLDVRLTEPELRRAGDQESVRNAVVLARVFERMAERALPWTTGDDLVRHASRRVGEPIPDVGLEDGR